MSGDCLKTLDEDAKIGGSNDSKQILQTFLNFLRSIFIEVKKGKMFS